MKLAMTLSKSAMVFIMALAFILACNKEQGGSELKGQSASNSAVESVSKVALVEDSLSNLRTSSGQTLGDEQLYAMDGGQYLMNERNDFDSSEWVHLIENEVIVKKDFDVFAWMEIRLSEADTSGELYAKWVYNNGLKAKLENAIFNDFMRMDSLNDSEAAASAERFVKVCQDRMLILDSLPVPALLEDYGKFCSEGLSDLAKRHQEFINEDAAFAAKNLFKNGFAKEALVQRIYNLCFHNQDYESAVVFVPAIKSDEIEAEKGAGRNLKVIVYYPEEQFRENGFDSDIEQAIYIAVNSLFKGGTASTFRALPELDRITVIVGRHNDNGLKVKLGYAEISRKQLAGFYDGQLVGKIWEGSDDRPEGLKAVDTWSELLAWANNNGVYLSAYGY